MLSGISSLHPASIAAFFTAETREDIAYLRTLSFAFIAATMSFLNASNCIFKSSHHSWIKLYIPLSFLLIIALLFLSCKVFTVFFLILCYNNSTDDRVKRRSGTLSLALPFSNRKERWNLYDHCYYLYRRPCGCDRFLRSCCGCRCNRQQISR